MHADKLRDACISALWDILQAHGHRQLMDALQRGRETYDAYRSTPPSAGGTIISDAKKEHWRQWAIDGMPADKMRLAEATWEAAVASVAPSATEPMIDPRMLALIRVLDDLEESGNGWEPVSAE